MCGLLHCQYDKSVVKERRIMNFPLILYPHSLGESMCAVSSFDVGESPPPFPQSMSPDWWLNTHNNYAQKGSAFGFWLLDCPSSPPLTVGVRFLIIIVSENFDNVNSFFFIQSVFINRLSMAKISKNILYSKPINCNLIFYTVQSIMS